MGRNDFDSATPDLAVSMDGGLSWREEFIVPPSEGRFEPNTIAVDPTDPNIVYVGSFDSNFFTGLARSTDGGRTWSEVSLGSGFFTRDIKIFSADPSIILAARSDGARISDDFGQTWRPVEFPSSFMNVDPTALAFAPNSANTLYLGSSLGAGLARSDDGGLSTDRLANGMAIADVIDLHFGHADSEVIVAALSGFDVVRSNDGGVSWQPINFGSFTNSTSGSPRVQIEPSRSTPGKWYAAHRQSFLVSTDSAKTWTVRSANGALDTLPNIRSMSIDPSDENQIFLAEQFSTADLAISTDGGTTWQTGPAPNDARIEDIAVNSNFLFIGTDDQGVFRSADGGSSWQLINNGLDNLRIRQIEVDPHVDGRLFLTDTSEDLFRSTDNGNSWVRISAVNSFADQLLIDPHRSNRLFILDNNFSTGLVFSEDGGDSWTFDSRGVPSNFPNRLSSLAAADISNKGKLIAGTRQSSAYTKLLDGLFKGSFEDTREPDFSLSVDTQIASVCAPGNIPLSEIQSDSINGFSSPIALSIIGSQGITGDAEPLNVTPGESSTLTGAVDETVFTGLNGITVSGTAISSNGTSITRAAGRLIDSAPQVPLESTIVSPAQNATAVDPFGTNFSWTAAEKATDYLLDVAIDSSFNNLVFSDMTTDTKLTVTGLETGSTHFARVTALNACGGSAPSTVVQFNTSSPSVSCASPSATWNPDDTGLVAESSITIAQSQLISNLRLMIDMNHTWVGDLVVSLVQESTGDSVVLMNQVCGSLDDIDVTLSDDSVILVGQNCRLEAPTVRGVRAPSEALSLFNNRDASGRWTIHVEDVFPADKGTLNQWCLVIN